MEMKCSAKNDMLFALSMFRLKAFEKNCINIECHNKLWATAFETELLT